MKELLIEEGRKQQRWRQRRSLLLFLIARQQISSLIRSETDPSTADAAMEWTSSCNDAEAAYAMDEESSGRCREAVFSSPDLVRFITGFL